MRRVCCSFPSLASPTMSLVARSLRAAIRCGKLQLFYGTHGTTVSQSEHFTLGCLGCCGMLVLTGESCVSFFLPLRETYLQTRPPTCVWVCECRQEQCDQIILAVFGMSKPGWQLFYIFSLNSSWTARFNPLPYINAWKPGCVSEQRCVEALKFMSELRKKPDKQVRWVRRNKHRQTRWVRRNKRSIQEYQNSRETKGK